MTEKRTLSMPIVVNAGISPEKAQLVANTLNELLSAASAASVLALMMNSTASLGKQMMNREKLDHVWRVTLDAMFGPAPQPERFLRPAHVRRRRG